MAAVGSTRRPVLLKNSEDYRIAIVVALAKEKDAVDAVLENPVSRRDAVKVSESDDNEYDFGTLGQHHVVVTQLPAMGKVNAASAAANMRRSFPNIKLCLLVGICGIVPVSEGDEGDTIERFLGDVVIAQSIIQYDFGKGTEGGFVRKSTVMDVPGRPSTKVQNLLAHLRTWKGKKELEKDLIANLEILLDKDDIPPSGYPSSEKYPDLAFSSSYVHLSGSKSCTESGCDRTEALPRERRPEPRKPKVFVGSVGVADLVQKSAQSRDAIAADEKVIAFEMESVGIWDSFPDVVVIKAGCDYADSHKNDKFHRYASATSVACAKAFLERYRLEGSVQYDDSTHRHDNIRANCLSRELQSSAAQGLNIYSGHFFGSNVGSNGTINNKW